MKGFWHILPQYMIMLFTPSVIDGCGGLGLAA
jgi:hypothetical protein